MTDGTGGRSPHLPDEADRLLRRSLTILALVTVVTAWFSVTFFHPDEHYQILEFMSYRLGRTAPSELPWEFAAHIRPWMQVFAYFWIARPLMALGFDDLFHIVFVLRLATGLLSLAALSSFSRAMLAKLERDDERRFFAAALPFFGYLPYLFVRTSSETASAAFFTWGLALVWAFPLAKRQLFLAAGLLCGLAFECRFQSAILVLSLLAWLVIVARARWTDLGIFCLGFGAVVALAVPVDRWGYGVWCFPPWDYLKVNLLDDVAAQRFGTDPFFAYAYLPAANFFLPVVALLLLAMVLTWIRRPSHVVTWVSLPFVLIHSIIAHKEERFLFPLAILATSFPLLAFSPSGGAWPSWASAMWSWRRGRLAKSIAGLSVAAMAILAVYPVGFLVHMPLARYLYRHFPDGLAAYTFERSPFLYYPMYRPGPLPVVRIASDAALDQLLTKGPVYILSETPTLPPGVLPPGVRATLVYSELPGAHDPRIAMLGTRAMAWDRRIDRKFLGLKVPQFNWMTLYRLDRGPE